ncbi:methyltransferase [Legionella beliardensis]|uniref:Methyltransferase n=1 Tax=Legionella beliardensis TaxID=91822 RepID=A0A378HZE4_9GAMM|nr:tetratricopeptide repeat protein [Legionella beliardensis]STX27881.1 methyltransferase [Legionella beliardensis]
MTAENELFKQANQFHHDNQLPQAIGLYEQILKQNPKHLQSLHFLGLAQAQLGDTAQAIECFTRALDLEPNSPIIYNNLANTYKKLYQLDQAIFYYQKAIDLAPDYAQAHNNLASIYAMQGLNQQALHHYHLALQAAPDFAAAHFNLGLLFLSQQNLDAARIQFQNVLSLNPKSIEAQFYLGVLALSANDLTQAEQAFHQVLLENSNHVDALTNLGVIAVKREQGQLGIDYFSKALALDNEHVEARNNLAATFMHHDRFENALMHYDYLLQKDPNNIEYLYNSGVAQMALGHLNEAISHFEHLLNQQSDHFAALNNLAAIYIRLNDKEKAQNLLSQALAVNPNDKASQHMLNAIAGLNKNTETAPEYATNLFNNYALYYDQHVQKYLKYTIPNQILNLLGDLAISPRQRTLDLGCGTGLTGQVLRDMTQTLTGVDIAKKMLDWARPKGIYDELVEAEALAYLSNTKDSYDLIVAADVLPYFGELTPLFQQISQHLTAEGYFIFTTEISSIMPWQLQTSARFSHHEHYLEQLAETNSLQIIAKKQIIARQQDDHPLPVLLVAMQKNPHKVLN